ncbi:MAG TPA: hypothetical protein VES20_22685 [Bryobacteraceae bacterium]|nr:hypothetical protein [Bryobacteraceae bacterium]
MRPGKPRLRDANDREGMLIQQNGFAERSGGVRWPSPAREGVADHSQSRITTCGLTPSEESASPRLQSERLEEVAGTS